MRPIDAELLTTNIAQIAKNCARSDAQKALIGRVLFVIDNMSTIKVLTEEQYNAELCEAKRLLKAAVEDIHELLCDKKNLDGNGQGCNICSYIEHCPCCKECTIREDLRNWRYADEALELIGEEGDRK